MKIWKAKLVLSCTIDDKYQVTFYFEKEEKEYKVNDEFNEWIHSADWTCDRISMNMIIERHYDNYIVTQGFDHELNETELKQLESDMRKMLKEKLNKDKEEYLQKIEEKISVI